MTKDCVIAYNGSGWELKELFITPPHQPSIQKFPYMACIDSVLLHFHHNFFIFFFGGSWLSPRPLSSWIPLFPLRVYTHVHMDWLLSPSRFNTPIYFETSATLIGCPSSPSPSIRPFKTLCCHLFILIPTSISTYHYIIVKSCLSVSDRVNWERLNVKIWCMIH